MSYLPSPVTGYYSRVNNTVVSGSELVSYLDPLSMRRLEFKAQCSSNWPLICVGGSTGVSMLPHQLIQAAISSLPVMTATTATGFINLGVDSASQAAAYIQLFDFQSTNERVLLRFHLQSTITTSIGFKNAVGSTANVVLLQSGNTASQGVNSTDLFTTGAVGTALSGAVGSERLVLVSASNLNSGAQVVNFNVLTNSL